MSEERGCPVLFLPNVIYWLLPIVADVLFSVLSTEKWACAGQSSRQQLCFPGFLRIPSTSSALLTLFCCRLFTGSQTDPALHLYLAPCHLYWEFWLAYPGSGPQILSVARASVSCSCSSAFSSTVREPIFPPMWQRTQNTSAGLLFRCLCVCSHVAPHALLSPVNCVSISTRVALSPPPRWHSRGPNSLSCSLCGNSDSRNITRSNSSAASSPPGKTYGKERRQHVLQNKEQRTVYLKY